MRKIAAAAGMLVACLIGAGHRGSASAACALTSDDKAANARLSFEEFDQKGTLPSTWRALDRGGCRAEAAEAMQAYMLDGPVADPHDAAVMAFHLGQTLARTSRTAEAAVAVAAARYAAAPEEDGFDWNTYVDGTWAYLTRDKARLEAAAGRLARAPGGRNRINAGALSGLVNCFDRPYAEAYERACRAPGPAPER